MADDVDYNESLATFIAHHATLRFFADVPEQRERAEAGFADERTFSRLLEALRAELERAYAGDVDAAAARALRAPIFARYQTEVFAGQTWHTGRFARFPERALSNAWLVANRAYLGDLLCFERELAARGGDLAAFVRAQREQPGESCRQPDAER